MALEIRPYRESDLEGMRAIWNAIVEAGNAFPQVYPLSAEEAAKFFAQQSLSAVAVIDDVVFGLYILHPNNVGRCGHVANARRRGWASAASSSTRWWPATWEPCICTRIWASLAWAPSPAAT